MSVKVPARVGNLALVTSNLLSAVLTYKCVVCNDLTSIRYWDAQKGKLEKFARQHLHEQRAPLPPLGPGYPWIEEEYV